MIVVATSTTHLSTLGMYLLRIPSVFYWSESARLWLSCTTPLDFYPQDVEVFEYCPRVTKLLEIPSDP